MHEIAVPSPADVRFEKQLANSIVSMTGVAINITMLSVHDVLAYILILSNSICRAGLKSYTMWQKYFTGVSFCGSAIFWYFARTKFCDYEILVIPPGY